MTNYNYSYTGMVARTIEARKSNFGLALYADALHTIKLEAYQILKNTRSSYYRLTAFESTNLRDVYELIGSTWVQLFNWYIRAKLVIFSEAPLGDLLFIPQGTLESFFSSETPVVPLWVAASDSSIYKNITISGADLSFSASGPWYKELNIDEIPVKLYVKQDTQNALTSLDLDFEVY